MNHLTIVPFRCVLWLAFTAALATDAQAAVTNVAWYRLGENDPGGVPGQAVTNTTTDLVGANHLKQFNSPGYISSVSAVAASRLGSSRAVNFNGTSQYLSNGIVSAAVDNFGLEAWVKPNATDAGNRTIVYNGDPTASGWGIIQRAGTEYRGSLGTMTAFGPGTAAAGVWAHLALVRDNGTTTFYVNGVATGTNIGTPIPPTMSFIVAAHPQLVANTYFNGAVDEVRVFTFAAGQFSTNDLLFNLQRVATLPATAITLSNATLNGTANPAGLPASAWFEWGPTTNYGNVTPLQAIGTGSTNFNQIIAALLAATPYHFRAVASNSLGTVRGTNQSFTTPLFTDIGVGSPGAVSGSAAWGDYDNDGRLDFLLTRAPNFFSGSEVWRNTGSGFTNSIAGLLAFQNSSAAWGDYDNDGWLDILIAGHDEGDYGHAAVRRNTGSEFTNSFFTDLGFGEGRIPVAWGDPDNDGRLDFLVNHLLYQNTGSGFTSIGTGLAALAYTSVAWGDYDNDGRLDILLDQDVYRNTGNGFSNILAGLPPVTFCSVAWGDYDNDGRLDILLTGTAGFSSTNEILSQVWRNTGSGFTNINAGLPGVFQSSAAWGDYDNDGRLDILLAGATDFSTTNGKISQVWRNTGSGFTNVNAGLPGVDFCSVAWGDYNNDGRLDILLTGKTNGMNAGGISQVWRNNTPLTNTLPTAPTDLTVATASNTVILGWNAASDAQTPASGLTYNVRIGTTPGGSDVLSPMSGGNGFRRLPQLGNAQLGLTATFTYTVGTRYYWSVQAIDNSMAGSLFAPEASFKLLQSDPVLVPPAATSIVVGDFNGDGVLDDNELNAVLANYWPTSPWLRMTNVVGLGGTNVTFTLSNSTSGTFSVEVTTNLVDWFFLGPATPRYLFTDTNAPTEPQRYYRLRTP